MLALGILSLLLALLCAWGGASWARADGRKRCAQALQHNALRDADTRLPNQPALLETLAQMLSLADRIQRPVTVLMVEIDGYKDWVAREPIEVMAAITQELGERMRQRVRGHDILGRWDEARFFVILPDTDVANALVLAEDLRQLSATQAITVAGRPLMVTLSMGVHGRQPSPQRPLRDLAADMVVAAQRALETTGGDGPNRIEIEP